MDRHYAGGFSTPGTHWTDSPFHCAHRVKVDLFRRYGCIAAAGDRHLAEFMPGSEYLRDPDTVRQWKFSLTGVQWRKDELKQRLEKSRAMASGRQAVDMEPSGDLAVTTPS